MHGPLGLDGERACSAPSAGGRTILIAAEVDGREKKDGVPPPEPDGCMIAKESARSGGESQRAADTRCKSIGPSAFGQSHKSST